MNSIRVVITCLMLTVYFSAFAQEKKQGYIKIDGKNNQKVPAVLLTEITVNLKDVTFEKAVNVISEKAKCKLNYNRNRVPVKKKVTVKMEKAPALRALLAIMKKTKTELRASKDSNLVIVPMSDRSSYIRSSKGSFLPYSST